jgi:hypothetical protein
MSQDWQDSFESFLADVGPPPTETHSLDRIDNNLGYSKDNVKWSTSKEQHKNRRVSSNVGSLTLREFCNSENVDYYRAYNLIVRKKILPSDAIKILKEL